MMVVIYIYIISNGNLKRDSADDELSASLPGNADGAAVIALFEVLHFSGPHSAAPRVNIGAPVTRIDRDSRMLFRCGTVGKLMTPVHDRILVAFELLEHCVLVIVHRAILVELEVFRHLQAAQKGRGLFSFAHFPPGPGNASVGVPTPPMVCLERHWIGQTVGRAIWNDNGNDGSSVFAGFGLVTPHFLRPLFVNLFEEIHSRSAHVALAEYVFGYNNVLRCRNHRFRIEGKITVVNLGHHLS